jgi:hypothetical protein
MTMDFSEAALAELLRALHDRTSKHPDDPGLIASWPAIREDQMAAACAELIRRGHPLFRVLISRPGFVDARDGWAIRAVSDQSIAQGL